MTTTVEFSNTSLSLVELTRLVDQDTVQQVRLDNVQLQGSDDDMYQLSRKLRGHPSLEVFSCKKVSTEEGTSLDAAVSCLLVSAYKLQTLHLEETPVTSSALLAVAHCTSLRHLELPNNGYSDDCAQIIVKGLIDSHDELIKTLDLSGNKISATTSKGLKSSLDSVKSLEVVKIDSVSASSNGRLADPAKAGGAAIAA